MMQRIFHGFADQIEAKTNELLVSAPDLFLDQDGAHGLQIRRLSTQNGVRESAERGEEAEFVIYCDRETPSPTFQTSFTAKIKEPRMERMVCKPTCFEICKKSSPLESYDHPVRNPTFPTQISSRR